MKNRLVLILCLFSGCLLLAGCTDADWDHVMNFGGSGEAEEMPAAPQSARAPTTPPPASAAAMAGADEPANADFCRSVAAQDAGGNGFDRATQTRVYARSYAQCLAIYTR